MSSGKKTLLLILSVLPIILLGAFIYYMIDWVMNLASLAPTNNDDPSVVMPIIGEYLKMVFALAVPAGLISLGVLIYYIIHIVNAKTMETGERVVWVVTMVLFCPLVFPIYWIMRIRNLPTNGEMLPPTTPVAQGPYYG